MTISSGNTAPTVAITSPSPTELFTVGAQYTLRGTATDPQDGTLPDSSLSWTVIRRHDTHTHPYLGPVARGTTSRSPVPTRRTSRRLRTAICRSSLTATDSAGSARPSCRTSSPRRSTSPSSRRRPAGNVTVNGVSRHRTDDAHVVGGLRAAAVRPGAKSDGSGRTYGFDRWSDGGAATHTYITPQTPATLTAILSLRGSAGCLLRRARLHRDAGRSAGSDRSGSTGAPARPVTGIGADTFSVRWSGQVSPRYSQTYTFSTTSDDGVRLWVNGALLIDQWNDHAPTVAQRHDRAHGRSQVRHRHGALRERRRCSRSAAVVEHVAAGGARAGGSAVPRLRGELPAGGCAGTAGYVADTGAVFGVPRWAVVRMERRQRCADPRP